MTNRYERNEKIFLKKKTRFDDGRPTTEVREMNFYRSPTCTTRRDSVARAAVGTGAFLTLSDFVPVTKRSRLFIEPLGRLTRARARMCLSTALRCFRKHETFNGFVDPGDDVNYIYMLFPHRTSRAAAAVARPSVRPSAWSRRVFRRYTRV